MRRDYGGYTIEISIRDYSGYRDAKGIELKQWIYCVRNPQGEIVFPGCCNPCIPWDAWEVEEEAKRWVDADLKNPRLDFSIPF